MCARFVTFSSEKFALLSLLLARPPPLLCGAVRRGRGVQAGHSLAVGVEGFQVIFPPSQSLAGDPHLSLWPKREGHPGSAGPAGGNGEVGQHV